MSVTIERNIEIGVANNMLWFTRCVDHNFAVGFATHEEAMRYRKYPDAWCRRCQAENGASDGDR